jgi:(5-formylfuran-3-yl)methyl phosphate synthase
MNSVRQSVHLIDKSALVVASGYADYRRFGGVSYMEVVRAAKDANCDVVMLDTAIKDGTNLFDAMNNKELRAFIEAAHHAGLTVALAGSIKKEHIETLYNLNVDIIGIRGAVCDASNRNNEISLAKVEEFLNQINYVNRAVSI